MHIRFRALMFASGASALVLPDGIGKLPALGWNSWNAYGCNINESAILSAAQSMVALGLKDAGYNYVNLDDCWSVKAGRDNVTNQMIPEPTKFPNGIKGLADSIHALGLKIGIYSSAGTKTCAGYPASIGYESVDAATFAAWGIDYLKYDNCNIPSNWTDECNYCLYDPNQPQKFTNGTCNDSTGLCPAGYDYSKSHTAARYNIMRDALLAQNRTILYSLCEWGTADVTTWGNATASSWRMSGDIRPSFNRVLSILNMNSFLLNAVYFWGHNDADMLEVGNSGLSPGAETRTHFAFWAAMKSPLITGTNLTVLSQQNLEILKNKHLLAFNQDPVYGRPATPYKWGVNADWSFNATNPAEYWWGVGSEGTLVLMLNTLGGGTRTMRADFGEIPGLKGERRREVVDVWTGTSLGCVQDELNVTVASHDTAVLLVKDDCGLGCGK